MHISHVSVGAPTKFTDETKKILLEAKTLGASDAHACDCAGISQTTLTTWRSIADSEKDSGKLDGEYYLFFQQMKRARGEHGLLALQRIKDASLDQKHWTAAAWLLERQFRADYARDLPPRPADDNTSKTPQDVLLRITQIIAGGAAGGDKQTT